MMQDRPSPDLLLRAMEIYLPLAYPQGVSPRAKTVQSQLSALGDAAMDDPLVFKESRDGRPRFWLRLGNASYPHMKLAIDQPAPGSPFVLRVDTHDKHCCPDSTSPEHGIFCKLMESNQKLAEQIEAAWEAAGLPTFKSYLREDLRKRKMQSAE